MGDTIGDALLASVLRSIFVLWFETVVNLCCIIDLFDWNTQVHDSSAFWISCQLNKDCSMFDMFDIWLAFEVFFSLFVSCPSPLAVLNKDLSSAKALYEQMQTEGILVDDLSLKRLAVLYRNGGETAPFPEPPVSHVRLSIWLVQSSRMCNWMRCFWGNVEFETASVLLDFNWVVNVNYLFVSRLPRLAQSRAN